MNAIGDTILEEILDEVRAAPFYSILLDSTIDRSKTDQMSFVIRYVKLEKDAMGNVIDFTIEESFLGFFEQQSSKSADMESDVLNLLEKLNISLEKLRGLGFDGASNMSVSFPLFLLCQVNLII